MTSETIPASFRKSTSRIELLRKPISRGLAALFTFIAVFSYPAFLHTGTGEIMESAGFVLLMFAALGRIWCSIYISGRKDRVLCTEGPYSLCRNPLYFFSFLGTLGFAIALQSFLLAAICATLYLIAYHWIIRSEESRLIGLFGDDYRLYQLTTPRFFPKLGPTRSAQTLVVYPRVIERCLLEVIWFLLTIVLLEFIEHLHSTGHATWFRLPF